jgi:hypothetical protein
VEINFTRLESFSTKSQEIRNSVLTGRHNSTHKLRPANIVLSRIVDLISDGGSFSYVDCKDSHFESAIFVGCEFDFAALINCEFRDSHFSGCSFHNVSVTGVDFHNVSFVGCALDHMVIENCRFWDCKFEKCTASNKLFEFCLLADCTFCSTDIQIHTIIGNYGITSSNLTECGIRDRSVGEDYRLMSNEDIRLFNVSTAVEEFKVAYFLEPSIVIEGSPHFDLLFEPEAWLGTAKIPLTFANLIRLTQEFLFYLYERQRCLTLPILKMHSLTGHLVQSERMSEAAATTVYGVHMALARVAESFITQVIQMGEAARNPLRLKVLGPLIPAHYIQNYPYIFDHDGLTIQSVRRMNSPNELALAWSNYANLIPIIAVFLASRLKFELSERTAINTPKAGRQDARAEGATNPGNLPEKLQSFFDLQVGFDRDNPFNYGVTLKSIFPGNLLVEFGLHLSTKQVSNTRAFLIDILKGSTGERNENGNSTT